MKMGYTRLHRSEMKTENGKMKSNENAIKQKQWFGWFSGSKTQLSEPNGFVRINSIASHLCDGSFDFFGNIFTMWHLESQTFDFESFLIFFSLVCFGCERRSSEKSIFQTCWRRLYYIRWEVEMHENFGVLLPFWWCLSISYYVRSLFSLFLPLLLLLLLLVKVELASDSFRSNYNILSLSIRVYKN